MKVEFSWLGKIIKHLVRKAKLHRRRRRRRRRLLLSKKSKRTDVENHQQTSDSIDSSNTKSKVIDQFIET